MALTPPRPALTVRLCNWVGEVVLSVPTLTRLHNDGYDLHLIGKPWAAGLLEGHGWKIYQRPRRRIDTIRQLHELRLKLCSADRDFNRRPNHLLFTNSFSSALEGRLAGLKPLGYRQDGRSLLLKYSVPQAYGRHAADNYWELGNQLVGTEQTRPAQLGLVASPNHLQRAADLAQRHGLAAGGYVILCPFSGAADTTGKKHWPPFPQLAAALQDCGMPFVLCPGPGEAEMATAQYPQAVLLDGVDLGTYAALALNAKCTVSNDTGPGHLAAAIGGRLVSVLGPDAADMWLAQGTRVTLLRSASGWPGLTETLKAVLAPTAR